MLLGPIIMERVGDDSAGFSVEFDIGTNTVHVRAWGFWDVPVSLAFAGAVRDACARHLKPALVMDMTELKPMRDEGQRAFATLLESLPGLGVVKTTVSTGSHLTRLQLLRISNESAGKTPILFT